MASPRVPEHTVNSVDEFLDILGEQCQSTDFLFRGQRDGWTLLPRVARVAIPPEVRREDVERSLIEEFKRRAYVHLRDRPGNDWDWLALAQHHSLPTRLLDWLYGLRCVNQ